MEKKATNGNKKWLSEQKISKLIVKTEKNLTVMYDTNLQFVLL